MVASGTFAARTIASAAESKRRAGRLWPIRHVNGSYPGPDGRPVPAGEYLCAHATTTGWTCPMRRRLALSSLQPPVHGHVLGQEADGR